MTRAARIALYRYLRKRHPLIRVRIQTCETPWANLLRTSYEEPALTYFIGEPIPLGERFRGLGFRGRRYFGVLDG